MFSPWEPSPSFPHGFFPGAKQPWHPVAHRAPPCALHPRSCVPGCCHRWGKCPQAADSPPNPADGHEFWGSASQGPPGRSGPQRGAGQGLLRDATQPLGTMQGANKGSPGVTLQRGCPRCLPEPTGTRRMGPRCGRHPWLAAGREAGTSGRGGPVLRRPQPAELLLLVPSYSCRAVFLAAGGRAEGVKPVTFGPFRCSSAGHLQISTIRRVMDLETM